MVGSFGPLLGWCGVVDFLGGFGRRGTLGSQEASLLTESLMIPTLCGIVGGVVIKDVVVNDEVCCDIGRGTLGSRTASPIWTFCFASNVFEVGRSVQVRDASLFVVLAWKISRRVTSCLVSSVLSGGRSLLLSAWSKALVRSLAAARIRPSLLATGMRKL